jgi:adenylate cyclase
MPAFRTRILIALALVCYCVLYQINQLQPSFYVRLSNSYRDAIARSGRHTEANPNLVFLAIDADSVGLDPATDAVELYGLTDPKSIEARAFSLMTEHYPWPREIYGLILERLVKAGAKVVLFDLTFPTETDGDAPFRRALENYRDHVVIGSNFVNPNGNGSGAMRGMLTRPPETLVPLTSPMDDRVAYTDFWPDSDDIVRQAQYAITFEQVEGEQPSADSERFLSLAAQACRKLGQAESAPTDLESHTIRFTGPPRATFPPHSLFEIFVPRYWEHNYGSGTFFRGKVVVIGAEGNWQHDEHQTPFGAMPGPELHLNAINAALHHEFIRDLPPGTVQLLTAVAAILAVLLSLFIQSPWVRFLVLAVADAGAIFATLYAFNRFSVDVPLLGPFAQMNLTVLLGMMTDFTQERLEKQRVRRTLERYVSRDVVGQMLDRPQTYEQSLGGITKAVTILFSDIRGFTAVTAQSQPHILVQQLNEYLGAMVECVFRFDGTLDKFIGDAVMAVWGNIRSHGIAVDALHAVKAARAMRGELQRLNLTWKERGWPELRAGIAIHHGDVIVGNVGSPRRMEFTVIGEAVNITWKLQEFTKEIGCPFLMSENVHSLVRDQLETIAAGQALLPALRRPIEIFTFPELHPGQSSKARVFAPESPVTV